MRKAFKKQKNSSVSNVFPLFRYPHQPRVSLSFKRILRILRISTYRYFGFPRTVFEGGMGGKEDKFTIVRGPDPVLGFVKSEKL